MMTDTNGSAAGDSWTIRIAGRARHAYLSERAPRTSSCL
jgi:hypothetical protein